MTVRFSILLGKKWRPVLKKDSKSEATHRHCRRGRHYIKEQGIFFSMELAIMTYHHSVLGIPANL
jgi:hypothetical protein